MLGGIVEENKNVEKLFDANDQPGDVTGKQVLNALTFD
jgi:hypothetical protein